MASPVVSNPVQGHAVKQEFPDRRAIVEAQRVEAQRKESERLAAVEAARVAAEAEAARIAAEQAKVVVAAPVAVSPATGGDAKAFIYNHESGNNPAAVNSAGCRGLGQACPGSKLPCGNDYACQDAYFTSYMQGRYGTWEAAMAFWLSHNWW